jgi:hypothetical protein
VGIDICDLDSSLGAMCQDMAMAVLKVREGNCLYTGACSPQVFVYTPGMYSVTNEDFVRGTVTNFYEMYGRADALSSGGALSSFTVIDNADRVCPADVDLLELQKRNLDYTANCASVQLERLQLALQIAR